MKTRIFFYYCLLLGLVMVSCSKDSENNEDVNTITSDPVAINATATQGTAEGYFDTGADPDDVLANSSFTATVKITFNGTGATVENAVRGVTIGIIGADVTVTSTVAEVAYEITGTTTDGMLKIYSDKKYKLALNGVSVKNSDGPAINLQSGKRVFVVLSGTNTIEDGAVYASSTEDQKGTLFSEGQLIFSGTGILNIAGNNKHALASDDYVRVQSGSITISKAASDGIHANDGVYIDGGTLNINAASDGIEAEQGPVIINAGTITITAADDGITASYDTDTSIDSYVVINGGIIDITTTGSGGEGIESKSIVTINDGTITIKAVDDGINAGDAIYINGGTIASYSTTNDGIDSNGTLTVTGGKIFAIGAKSPEEGFDCDNNTFRITGGLLIGAGGATSSPTAGVSTQASAILGSGNTGVIYSVLDNDNKEVLTFKSPAGFTTLLLSGSTFTTGSTYKLVTVSNESKATDLGGLYLSGTYSNPVLSSTFTLSSMVTKIGGSSGGGRP